MSKKLIKSGMIVSGMTLASRVMGLVRDVVIANLLGAGVAADVFFFANRIPNFLRRLFAEGAFNQAFVPVMTEYKKKGDESEVRELLAAVAGTLGGIVTVVTLLGVLGSGVLTALFGWGWFWDWLHGGPAAEKFEMASLMLKITFPYLWFITFTAMAGAILNTFGRFGVSSFTPIFLNITMIAAAWWISPWLDDPELALAIGVFLGGLVQFLFQFPFLRQINMLVWPKWGWHHPGVVKIRTLMIPALFGVSVSQINLLVNTMLASFLATGAISYLYYSDRLLEFPLGMFGVAISTVILPALAKKHVDADPADFSRTMDWGVRMVMLLGLPAMVGIASAARTHSAGAVHARRVRLARGEHVQRQPAGIHHGPAVADADQGAGPWLLCPPGYPHPGADRDDVDGGQHGLQPHLHLSARLRGAGALDCLLGHAERGPAVQGAPSAECLSALPPHRGILPQAADRKSADGGRAPLPLPGSGPMGRLAHEQGEHAADHAAGAGGRHLCWCSAGAGHSAKRSESRAG